MRRIVADLGQLIVHTRQMADDLRGFDGWFDVNEWPSAPCPVCKLGDLHPHQGSVKTVTTTSYDRHEHDDGWEPEWKHGFFYGILFCGRSACREKVIVSGEYRVTMKRIWEEYIDELRLRFAIPALPLVIPPTNTPNAVLEGIDAASRIVWTDPAGAANGLRRAVEAVLDNQKVRKTQTVGHKRVRLPPHQRIRLLKAQQPVAAASLEAVKWLGNEGSHSSAVLTSSHCIESAEYLNHALRILYDKTDAALVKNVEAINKARGLVRSRQQGPTSKRRPTRSSHSS
jgi:Domain of unknown function (DUF4145)